MPRLKRVDCSAGGITRHKAGKGFRYVDQNANKVTDPPTLERIKRLVIPPAWSDVWICAHPMGHIQAVGIDAKGRKQYRYHDIWRLRRDGEKFDHMLAFARALPRIRQQASADLATEGLTRARVLACAARLLDLGFFRIGTEGYAEENQTYGLATMRKSHVKVQGDILVFDYIAKSGKRRIQSVADPDVVAVVRELKARRGGGPELLAYRTRGSKWVDVKSSDINAYIKEATGGDFTAKDFRTWSATVLAAVALAVSSGVARSESGRKRAIARAMQEVSAYLGNTPAVCRSSYVDPRIIDRYTTNATVLDALSSLDEQGGLGGLHTHGAIEEAVLDLLGDGATRAAEAA
ncbi:MAG: DNA topoisomerase IB [Actinomycetota bacterium]|nr:DNA topoisomerase IB [Actinomycetota bacterium]